jgi:peptide/nickel transport system permease protein
MSAVVTLAERRDARFNWARLLHELVDRKAWVAFVIIVGGLLLVWLTISKISPYNPATVYPDRILLPIGSPGNPLGTDAFGRDELTRLASGILVSILAGVLPATAGMAFGVAIGLVSATLGGVIDRALMAVMDVLLAFPFILTAILAVAVLGPSLQNAMIAVTIAIVPRNARIIRAEVLSLRERDFIVAAKLSGAGPATVMRRHLLRNVLPTALIIGSTEVGTMIASTSGLSFLVLGVQPPDVDWGTLISDGSRFITIEPQLALMPIVLLAIVTLAFVALADDLRRRLSVSDT